MRLIYEHEGKIFEIGDLVYVEYLNIFTNKIEEYKGRILKCSVSSIIELDVSEVFASKKVNLDISEIKNIVLM
ncbi:MAG: hypothetical protein ACRCTZ_07785 [Sarcina sp.]